jgi:hypothetical protein
MSLPLRPTTKLPRNVPSLLAWSKTPNDPTFLGVTPRSHRSALPAFCLRRNSPGFPLHSYLFPNNFPQSKLILRLSQLPVSPLVSESFRGCTPAQSPIITVIRRAVVDDERFRPPVSDATRILNSVSCVSPIRTALKF